MNYKQFKKIKVLITSFIAATVAMAVVYNNIILSLAGVLIGILFLFFVRKRTKAVLVDEGIQAIGEHAAYHTYIILTASIAFLSFVFIGVGQRTGDSNYESLGTIYSYISL